MGGELRGEAGDGQGACRGPGGHPGRARGGPIAVSGRRQGKALYLLRFRHVCQERGGGGSAGDEPSDCVESRKAAAALALDPNVAALSSLFRDVLRLL